MIKRFAALATSSIALGALFVLPVYAAGLTGTASTGVNVGTTVTGSDAGNSSSGSDMTTGSANTSASAGVSANGSANTTSGSPTVTTGAVGGTVSTGGTGSSNSAMGSDDSTSGSTNGMLMLSDTDSAVMNYSGSAQDMSDASMVSTSEQLQTFSAGMLHANPNIESVQASNSNVSMSYKEDGHLFGFIPLSLTVRSMADASGNVTVSYPWYHFLVTTNDSNLQSDMQSHVKTSLSSNAMASANGSASGNSMTNGTNSMSSSSDDMAQGTGNFSTSMQAQIMSDMAAAFGNTK